VDGQPYGRVGEDELERWAVSRVTGTSQMTGASPAISGELREGAAFATTHWSVVLAAGRGGSPDAHDALQRLCQTYWYSLYAYIRRQGHPPHDAQDLTQEFFARMLERHSFRLADRSRGRFRTFLLASLKHFLINDWNRGQRLKRGGGCSFLSLEVLREAETHFLAEPADPAVRPDQAFERQWALALLESVLSRLREEFVGQGRADHFDALKVFIWGDQTTVSQVEVATRLGVTPNALGVQVHRLRRRFGELLRETIRHTVSDEAEIDGELGHLMAAITS
jgi:RNA polymerase sigma-70 factor (ECF subfamily)